jgi:hypothetical protein
VRVSLRSLSREGAMIEVFTSEAKASADGTSIDSKVTRKVAKSESKDRRES